MPILQSPPFTGTQVNYSLICLTKLWLFSHNVTMESSSDLVAMGQFIHETSYSRERKDVVIGRIGIDFVKKGDRITVHEVKKSKRFEKAHRYQVYYYIYYLQVVLGIPDVDGMLDYPKIRKQEHLTLTDDIREELEQILHRIEKTVQLQHPPPPVRGGHCKKCAYYELCWV
ncbi:MAG: CRISPR-associated protein Cas4 [Methanoculleus sp.]